jgi:RHS repeat-associated protein
MREARAQRVRRGDAVAATAALRATMWGDNHVMPAPDWVKATKPVFNSPSLPVEAREPLASLDTFISSVTAKQTKASTILSIDSLALAANGGGTSSFIEETFSARFQALPFSEPLTGLVYARARWYDPMTGAFLTPDPEGYTDSSNLYAFCAGDPVNCTDPTGEWGLKDAWETTKSVAGMVVGVVESAGEAVYNLNPVVSTVHKAKDTYARSKRVASAYKKGGSRAAAAQYASEVKNYTTSVIKSLPIVNTVIQASEIPAAYETALLKVDDRSAVRPSVSPVTRRLFIAGYKVCSRSGQVELLRFRCSQIRQRSHGSTREVTCALARPPVCRRMPMNTSRAQRALGPTR